MIQLEKPVVVPFKRSQYLMIDYLAKVARVSRGIDPFCPKVHKDWDKNTRTVTLCADKGHNSIFEFWPFVTREYKDFGNDKPGMFKAEDGRFYFTLAHILRDHYHGISNYYPASNADYPCFHITCSRVALAQLTRYRRWFSYNVESQRYCNYVKRPYRYYLDSKVDTHAARGAVAVAYRSYEVALACGAKPETARYLLPSATVTTMVMAAPRERWEYFLKQRLDGSTGKPQSETQEIARQIAAYVRQ